MKVCSLKTLALCFTMVGMTSTTGVFAHHSHHSSSESHHCLKNSVVEDLNVQVGADLAVILGAEQNIFSVQGAFTNPNPLTNPAVAATITSQDAIIAAAISNFSTALQKLGVHSNTRSLITEQMTDWTEAAITYSTCVNNDNTNPPNPACDELGSFNAFSQAAEALGDTLAHVTKDDNVLTLVLDITNLQGELIQAFRCVLDNSDIGAIPGDCGSEATAATLLEVQIQVLGQELAALLVSDLADKKCK